MEDRVKLFLLSARLLIAATGQYVSIWLNSVSTGHRTVWRQYRGRHHSRCSRRHDGAGRVDWCRCVLWFVCARRGLRGGGLGFAGVRGDWCIGRSTWRDGDRRSDSRRARGTAVWLPARAILLTTLGHGGCPAARATGAATQRRGAAVAREPDVKRRSIGRRFRTAAVAGIGAVKDEIEKPANASTAIIGPVAASGAALAIAKLARMRGPVVARAIVSRAGLGHYRLRVIPARRLRIHVNGPVIGSHRSDCKPQGNDCHSKPCHRSVLSRVSRADRALQISIRPASPHFPHQTQIRRSRKDRFERNYRQSLPGPPGLNPNESVPAGMKPSDLDSGAKRRDMFQ